MGHHSNLEKENIESKSKVDGSQFTLLELKLLYLSEISFDIYYKLAGRGERDSWSDQLAASGKERPEIFSVWERIVNN